MTRPDRLRGRKLQRLRRSIFAREPLCRACYAKGRTTAAEELDHITPLHKGGTDHPDNLQPLCADCHATKTARDLGHRERVAIGPDGWPVEE